MEAPRVQVAGDIELPVEIPLMLGRSVDVVFGALGYRVLREELLRQIQGTLGWDRLQSLPIKPRTIIDIGVADGTPELYSAFPDAFLVLVEPVEEFFAGINNLLKQRRGIHLPFAVGREDAEMSMRVELVEGAKSSLLRRTPLSATGKEGVERKIRIRPLDSAIDGVPLESPVLLKIDVEGFELSVLEGAVETLKKVDLIIIETSIAKRFHDGPSLAQIIAFMAAQQFSVQDIVHIARDPNSGIRHADLVFTRDA